MALQKLVDLGGGGGASVTVSDGVPDSPSAGSLWFESDTAQFFIYYDNTWVEIGGGLQGPQGEPGSFSSVQTIEEKTANYTLVSSDAGKIIKFNTSSNTTLTVNTATSFSIGQSVDIVRFGTGDVTVSGSGVTVVSTPGVKLRARYSAGTLLYIDTDQYLLIGDLSA